MPRQYAAKASQDAEAIVKDRPRTARRTGGFEGVDAEDIVKDRPVKKTAKRDEWIHTNPGWLRKRKPKGIRWRGQGLTPQEMFPEWDWGNLPLGPPLDDALVRAYCDDSWGTFLRE